MNSTHWSRDHREWHRLFDALCDRKGFFDNTELASLFCLHSGRKRQEDFEAAKSKLRNWRTGQHVPRQANFLILAEILEVDQDQELRRRWADLYRTAGKCEPSAEETCPFQKTAASGRKPWWVLAGTVPLAGLAFAMTTATETRTTAFVNLPSVGYQAYVRLSLGTSRLIHGEFEDCDGPPPPWDKVATRVPSTALGVFSDGGIARKMVNDCGKEMLVRAVMFTGLSAGVEEIRLLDDFMKIEVLEQASQLRMGEGP